MPSQTLHLQVHESTAGPHLSEGTVMSAKRHRSDLLARAKAGSPDAQLELGRARWKGNGTKKDQAEALKWFRAAAQSGRAEHQMALGLLICWEEGKHRDFAEGFNWV